MKNLVLLFVLLPALAGAGATKPNPPNPADYTVVIHVVFSRAQLDRAANPQQALETVIDGRKVEMVCGADGVLVPGDYKAKLYVDIANKPYNTFEHYDLLLPDMTVRSCAVIGLGPDPKG